MRLRSFAVVGPGRIGTLLATLWRGSGLECRGFHGRRAAAVAQALRRVGQGRRLSFQELRAADLVLCAVPDAALEEVAAAAAAAGGVQRGSLWVHPSGAVPASCLRAVRAHGAALGSLHPLCAAPTVEAGLAALPGGYCAVEGPASVLPVLERLTRRLGARPLRLRAERKLLYHAAAVLASNQVVALLAHAHDVLERALGRVPRRVVAELAGGAVAQLERLGGRRALTGPLARGETLVVRRHLEVLDRVAPTAAAVYRALSMAALPLLAGEDRRRGREQRELRRLLQPRAQPRRSSG